MDIYDEDCYIDKSNKRTKFEPQEIIKIIKSNNKLYFPNLNKVDFSKLKITNIGVFSVAVPSLAKNIILDMKKKVKYNIKTLTITDALANCGGMSIQFCYNFKHVNCCEIMKEHCEILNNNLKTYGFNNYNIFCGDYMDNSFTEDIVFFDPPWGSNYMEKQNLDINNINILCIINNILNSQFKEGII